MIYIIEIPSSYATYDSIVISPFATTEPTSAINLLFVECYLVAFKYMLAIQKFLVLKKLYPKILNILNHLLLSYFLINFDETLRTADQRNILLYLHFFA